MGTQRRKAGDATIDPFFYAVAVPFGATLENPCPPLDQPWNRLEAELGPGPDGESGSRRRAPGQPRTGEGA